MDIKTCKHIERIIRKMIAGKEDEYEVQVDIDNTIKITNALSFSDTFLNSLRQKLYYPYDVHFIVQATMNFPSVKIVIF